MTPDPQGGDLTLPVRCFVDPSHLRPSGHDAVWRSDWTLQVPHDLGAERVAVAFGGYLSCLALVEQVAAAARVWWRRQCRVGPLAVVRRGASRWRASERAGCCPSSGFAVPQAAGAHARSVTHVAAVRGVDAGLLGDLARGLLRARGLSGGEVPSQMLTLVGRCVPDRGEARRAWEVGLSPAMVVECFERVGASRPLGCAFYLSVLSDGPDLEWLRESAAAAPDAPVHDWLAVSETARDRADRGLRGSWLRLGLARQVIEVLTDTSYCPEEIARFAESVGLSPAAAGAVVGAWVGAGCRPDLAVLAQLWRERAFEPGRINAAVLDRVEQLLADSGQRYPREGLAYALLVAGTPHIAVQLLTDLGSCDPRALTVRMRRLTAPTASSGRPAR